jgi:lipoyl(octanoyl) transferase
MRRSNGILWGTNHILHEVTPSDSGLLITILGQRPYLETLFQMQAYTANRRPNDPDQIWLVEHKPVYTRGKLSRNQDILADLPHAICDTDRGGQITYHGPGQLIVYYLMDVWRQPSLSLKNLLSNIETMALSLLDDYAISAYANTKNRGIYVNNCKIASIGLRATRRGTYHGLALNVAMDLEPFSYINPCGARQKMVDIASLSSVPTTDIVDKTIGLLQQSSMLAQQGVMITRQPFFPSGVSYECTDDSI